MDRDARGRASPFHLCREPIYALLTALSERHNYRVALIAGRRPLVAAPLEPWRLSVWFRLCLTVAVGVTYCFVGPRISLSPKQCAMYIYTHTHTAVPNGSVSGGCAPLVEPFIQSSRRAHSQHSAAAPSHYSERPAEPLRPHVCALHKRKRAHTLDQESTTAPRRRAAPRATRLLHIHTRQHSLPPRSLPWPDIVAVATLEHGHGADVRCAPCARSQWCMGRLKLCASVRRTTLRCVFSFYQLAADVHTSALMIVCVCVYAQNVCFDGGAGGSGFIGVEATSSGLIDSNTKLFANAWAKGARA